MKSLISKGISEFTFGFEIGYLMPLGERDQRFKPNQSRAAWPHGAHPLADGTDTGRRHRWA